MRLQTRFNLALAAISVAAFGLSVLVTYRVLLHNAKDEVLRNAALMMETALAVRSYTVEEINLKTSGTQPRLHDLAANGGLAAGRSRRECA